MVDDNEANRRMNKSRLVLDGFTVAEAANGIEAISRLNESPPDIVVLDLYMDRMDGFKVLEYMKGDERFKAIPVIVLSARSAPAEKARVMSFGADVFLIKMTTSPMKLSEQVKAVLAKRHV